MITVPSPFDGASACLDSAYHSILTQVNEVNDLPPGDDTVLQTELTVRRQLDGYLRTFRIECRLLIREWARRAYIAKRESGLDSLEFLEAQRNGTRLIERLDSTPFDANRTAIKALVKLLSRSAPIRLRSSRIRYSEAVT